MKNKAFAAFAALLALQPGVAAASYRPSLVQEERGAFAGARLRVPLGTSAEKPRAGIAIAGMERARSGELRFSRGIELGLGSEGKLAVAVGGVPVGPAKGKTGVSPLGWVAIGAGVIAVSLFTLYALCGSGEICGVGDE